MELWITSTKEILPNIIFALGFKNKIDRITVFYTDWSVSIKKAKI